MSKKSAKRSFLRRHSLSIVAIAFLVLWIILYACSNPQTHLGSFFGNAIADWSGSVVIILGTKFLVEIHSAESRPAKAGSRSGVPGFLWRHSLLIFLGITGIGWAILFARMDAQGKWGQVVGNIVSEWVQMSGLVFLTNGLVEQGSKESAGR